MQQFVIVYWSFIEKTSVKQSMKCKVCSNFQMQMYPPVESSSGQGQYYIRWAWHLEECNCKGTFQSDVPQVKESGGQEQYYVRSAWHLQEMEMQLRRQLSQTYPPLEVSGGQEQYYVRSSWHWDMLQVRLTFSHTPSRGILWPRAVLCKVIMTLGYALGQADLQSDVPPVEASGGQEQFMQGHHDIGLCFGSGWSAVRFTPW